MIYNIPPGKLTVHYGKSHFLWENQLNGHGFKFANCYDLLAGQLAELAELVEALASVGMEGSTW